MDQVSMPQQFRQAYASYRERMREISRWQHIAACLQWDMEVSLPSGAFQGRAEQIASVHNLLHRLIVSPDLFALLEELEALPESNERANVVMSLRDIRRKQKYSAELVERISMKSSLCLDAWNRARRDGDTLPYLTELEGLVSLKREEVDCLGYAEHPYDALMEEFEPGMTVAAMDRVFAGLIPGLKELITKKKSGKDVTVYPDPGVSNDILWKCGIELLQMIGFDFRRGRQDISTHPFTTTLGVNDVRVTTRIPEDNPADMIWSCLHEGGHALYEQALGEHEQGLPIAEATSLGVHESQSRLWENHIGRSLHFWNEALPRLQNQFPGLFSGMSATDLYKEINRVCPGYIRTQADELTYHLHILIRYEIEKELISGSLPCAGIPERWNQLYEEHLGVKVISPIQGFLQDIHWAHGSFGYFPTYTIGSLYAAQFFHHASRNMREDEREFKNLDFSALHSWLNTRIYTSGRSVLAEQLCLNATGEKLNPDYFLQYIHEKFNSN